MKYEKGKKITDVCQFKKGRKYMDISGEVFEFSHIGKSGGKYFKYEGQDYHKTESEHGCIGFRTIDFYEVVEVPEWEIGKEYEFSDDGELWSAPMKLVGIIEHEFKYIVDAGSEASFDGYKQIREIKPKVKELTLEEIAEKFGCDVSEIKIKN